MMLVVPRHCLASRAREQRGLSAGMTALLESTLDRPRELGTSEVPCTVFKSSVVLPPSARMASTPFTTPSKACPTISLLSTGKKEFSK